MRSPSSLETIDRSIFSVNGNFRVEAAIAVVLWELGAEEKGLPNPE